MKIYNPKDDREYTDYFLHDICMAVPLLFFLFLGVGLVVSCHSKRPALTVRSEKLIDAIVNKPFAVESQIMRLAPVHFATASDKIIKEDFQVLEANAKWLEEHPETAVVLEGHCDERGPDRYNAELGDKRARRVKYHLLSNGLAGRDVIVISRGKKQPLDKRHSPLAWKENRRVEFVVR